MQFNEVIGQQNVSQKLRESVSNHRIAHAQFFAGSNGSGNLPLAMSYVQFVLCQNRTKEACGNCRSCKMMKQLSHPDVHFAFPVANTGSGKSKPLSKNFLNEWREMMLENPYSELEDWINHLDIQNKQLNIGVNESESIVRQLSLKSYEGGHKVLILWHPEKLNIQAANKLLKLIEEPVGETLILFVGPRVEDVLATIISRTQIIQLNPIEEQDIAQYLIDKLNSPKEEAQNISHLTEGNLSKAIRWYNHQGGENIFSELFIEWMRLCFKALKVKDLDQLATWNQEMAGLGRERLKSFFTFCTQVIRKALLNNYGSGNLSALELKAPGFDMAKFSPYIHADNCMTIIQELTLAARHIERNANAKIVMMDTSFKIARQLHHKLNVDSYYGV